MKLSRLSSLGQPVSHAVAGRHLHGIDRRAAAHGAIGRGLEAVPPASPSIDLRVASYNVHKCVGTDGKFDPCRVASVIAELDADVVALQEADRRFGRRTGLLDVRTLEQRAGLVPVPVSQIPDGLGWHGNALLVRPGTICRFRRLALPGAEPRGAVIAELVLPGSGAPLQVIAAHFGLLRRCRTRQVEAVLAALAAGSDLPTLMMGDLNEWRGDARRSGLRAFEPLFGPVGQTPASFPSRRPLLSLDRILGCPRARVLTIEAHHSPLARVASDHLPLKARIRLAMPGLEAAAPMQAKAA
ncbi:endonuclease/exonuclease/phosphatase family protein [Paeniroseomonas aquatica]|uniref:Endonuclease/exonuclease/phosphatase family protein n=1 Tax=Paeniroseomonas aquatica TaxID=373043 RepID=A0ABT8A5I7_9PROT|nr:endonuclease/exonuclease/phosphatase family protein [Paeniroseomonas aquatica]MDN3564896.1 endonuclease/exonuclease/phosphatase family protein [Paeniroseomonas aquatica]